MTGFPKDWSYEDEYKFVIFDEDFDDRFVGLDGRVYGPFRRGKVVRVPVEQAWVLIDRGVCREY